MKIILLIFKFEKTCCQFRMNMILFPGIMGHLIWSEQFDGYVVGIGDFLPAGPLSRTNENPLKTNSFIGKLILLDSN